jgi:hypothetical protein
MLADSSRFSPCVESMREMTCVWRVPGSGWYSGSGSYRTEKNEKMFSCRNRMIPHSKKKKPRVTKKNATIGKYAMR